MFVYIIKGFCIENYRGSERTCVLDVVHRCKVTDAYIADTVKIEVDDIG